MQYNTIKSLFMMDGIDDAITSQNKLNFNFQQIQTFHFEKQPIRDLVATIDFNYNQRTHKFIHVHFVSKKRKIKPN